VRFVSDDLTRFILLVAVDPFGANNIVLARIRSFDKLLDIIEFKLVKLFFHSLNPF
jgi:hypothetical protein